MDKITFTVDEDFDTEQEKIIALAMNLYAKTEMGKLRFEKFTDEFTKARYKKNATMWASLVEQAGDAQTWDDLVLVVEEIHAHWVKNEGALARRPSASALQELDAAPYHREGEAVKD